MQERIYQSSESQRILQLEYESWLDQGDPGGSSRRVFPLLYSLNGQHTPVDPSPLLDAVIDRIATLRLKEGTRTYFLSPFFPRPCFFCFMPLTCAYLTSNMPGSGKPPPPHLSVPAMNDSLEQTTLPPGASPTRLFPAEWQPWEVTMQRNFV
jgi:hypothetical protein